MLQIRHTIFVLFLLSISTVSFAGVDLPWTTTYDCDAWDQTDGITEGDVNCSNLFGGGAWLCNDTDPEEITTDANYSSGGGGRGQRHLIGDSESNSNSGGLQIDFNTPQSEIWMRFYTRFQTGFDWTAAGLAGNQLKLLYFRKGEGVNLMPFYLPRYVDSMGMYNASADPPEYAACDECGWVTQNMVNGNWNSIELHIKAETVAGDDGVFEIWFNGALTLQLTDVNYGMDDSANYITGVLMGSNAGIVAELSGCEYIDYDDIVINNTGYIGPVVQETGGRSTASGNGNFR